jgi:hypothetical protein
VIDVIIEIGFGSELATWSIYSLEDSLFFEIAGQFPPQDFSYGFNAKYTETGLFTKSDPITNYTGKSADKVSFKGLFWSEYNFLGLIKDDISMKLKVLELLIKPLPDKMRPPLVCLEYGENFSLEGFVTDISDIKHDVYTDGILKGVSFSISMIKAGTYTLSKGGPGAFFRQKQTRYINPKGDDTFENIAYSEYGDPLRGVTLQQINYKYEKASDADVIQVYEKDHPRIRETPGPSSLQCKEGVEFSIAFKKVMDARSGSRRFYRW